MNTARRFEGNVFLEKEEDVIKFEAALAEFFSLYEAAYNTGPKDDPLGWGMYQTAEIQKDRRQIEVLQQQVNALREKNSLDYDFTAQVVKDLEARTKELQLSYKLNERQKAEHFRERDQLRAEIVSLQMRLNFGENPRDVWFKRIVCGVIGAIVSGIVISFL